MSEETVAQVFWRMVGEGVSSFDIGHHPDYRAAVERERVAHEETCPKRNDTLAAGCFCRDKR